ncbi:MAG TPA: hypothetical protein PK530_03755 [Anaerolineales bacterium]|nr:hypothetical protein [Anaerolineales bacterium]
MAEITLTAVMSKLRISTVREDTWDLEDIGRAARRTRTRQSLGTRHGRCHQPHPQVV